MNRIVREHYPVEELPENLRLGLPDNAAVVRVTIETEQDVAEHDVLKKPDKVLTLKELFALRRPPYKTTEQIVEEVRRMRDEWDD